MKITQNPRKSCKKMRIKFLKSTWFFDNFESLNIFSIGSVFCLEILTTLIPKQFYHLVTGSVFALKFWQLWFPEEFPLCVCFWVDILTTLTPNRTFFHVSLFLALTFWQLWFPEEFPLCVCFWLDILTTLTPWRISLVSLFLAWYFDDFDSLKNFPCVSQFWLVLSYDSIDSSKS